MKKTKICPECGKEVLEVAKKCKHCGYWFDTEYLPKDVLKRRCPICDEIIPDDVLVCPYCDETIGNVCEKNSDKSVCPSQGAKKISTVFICIGGVMTAVLIAIILWMFLPHSNPGTTIKTKNEKTTPPAFPGSYNPDDPSIAIDLGLSVKWAPINVGSYGIDNLGDKFAWGETSSKAEYNWVTYKYAKGSSNTYVPLEYGDIKGTEYDAATVNWGKNWRMPTTEEFDELIQNCTFIFKNILNHVGFEITGPNGNKVFFPCEYMRYYSYYDNQDKTLVNITEYYSSQSDELNRKSVFANALTISNTSYSISIKSKDGGGYIRPVLVE